MFAIEMPVLPMRSSSTASLKSSRVIRSSLRSVLERRSSFDQDKETCAVSLSRMVANFMEESDVHQRSAQHITAVAVAASQEEEEDSDVMPTNTIRTLKELVRCADAWERKILEETRNLVMAAKMDQVYDAKMIKVRVRDGLWSLGFNASLCISKWDRTPRHPHGHHEYIDVITDGSFAGNDDERRIIVDLELGSEFDVARCTRHFSSLLNAMPEVFVGRPERLRRVVSMMADAAVKSLERQEFHVPPWRRPDYMLCKWFSPFTRCAGHRTSPQTDVVRPIAAELMCAHINGPRLGERSSMVGLENDEDGGDDGLSSMSSSEEEEEFNGWRWNSRPPLPLMQRRKVFAGLTATQIL